MFFFFKKIHPFYPKTYAMQQGIVLKLFEKNTKKVSNAAKIAKQHLDTPASSHYMFSGAAQQ